MLKINGALSVGNYSAPLIDGNRKCGLCRPCELCSLSVPSHVLMHAVSWVFVLLKSYANIFEEIFDERFHNF